MIRPLAATMLALLPCGAAGASVPPATFLDAFVEACLDEYRDPDARDAAIAAAGWRPVADTADPMLADLMAASREALADAESEDGTTGSVAVFARPLAGFETFLVTTELDMPSGTDWEVDLLGCYLYDFTADLPLDPDRITQHFGEGPAETQGQDGIIIAQVWNLEKIEGVWELRSTFIPEGSPASSITGFSGRVLSVTTSWEEP